MAHERLRGLGQGGERRGPEVWEHPFWRQGQRAEVCRICVSPHTSLQGLMNTVTGRKPPAKWTALHFLTHCHPLLLILLMASRERAGESIPST